MVFEAIVAQARLLLPQATKFWIVSENARTYQNEIIPVMAPFIYGTHGFELNSVIHPETARGKSLVDAHLTIAMIQVHRFVKETKLDVTTLEDLVRALHHGGGTSNCAVELVSVHRDGTTMEKWSQVLMGRHIMPLRRVGKFVYGPFTDGVFPVQVFAYSGGAHVTCFFGEKCFLYGTQNRHPSTYPFRPFSVGGNATIFAVA